MLLLSIIVLQQLICIITLNMDQLQREKQKIIRRSKKIILFRHQHENIETSPQLNVDPDSSYAKKLRSKSPPKNTRQSRSLSKKQKRQSKDSRFSSKDKKMTREMSNEKLIKVNRVEYGMNNKQQNHRLNRLNNQQVTKKAINQKQNASTDRKQILLKLKNNKNASSKSRNKMLKIQRKISVQKYINQAKNKELEELQNLRQQNQYVKIVYKSSVQKMKRLQEHLQSQKNQYQIQRKKYQRQLNQLKNRAKSDKKVNLGHIYSYDDKSFLEVKPDQIIIETDRQDSSMMEQSRKKQDASKLSLHSKMYQNIQG